VNRAPVSQTSEPDHKNLRWLGFFFWCQKCYQTKGKCWVQRLRCCDWWLLSPWKWLYERAQQFDASSQMNMG